MHAVVAIPDPSGAGPDVAIDIGTDAVRIAGLVEAVQFHRGELASFFQLFAIDIPHLDVLSVTGVGDVELAQVGREAEAVGFEDVIGHLGDRAGFGIDAVDGFLEVERSLVTLVMPHAAVAGIGEPDRAVALVHYCVVWCVERFTVEARREDGYGSVVFVSNHPAVAVLAGNLAALIVERVAVAVAAGFAE